MSSSAAVKAICPQMRSGRGVDELPGDTHSVACLSDAAFEDVTNPQLAPDLLNVHGSTLVGKAGVPGDDEETSESATAR